MKGHGIFIGVNKLWEDHYNMPQHKFEQAFTNAFGMFNLTNDTGLYNIDSTKNLFHGEGAKWFKIRNLLREYAEISQKEAGYLFIYFSGHGFQINEDLIPKDIEKYEYNFEQDENNESNKRKKEKDNKNRSKNIQFLCFYDRMVPESEIRKELKKFSSKFKIYIILDSCFSDGISDILPSSENFNAYFNKSLIAEDKKPTRSFRHVFLDNIEKYKRWLCEFPNSIKPKFKADVCYMTACKDNQRATIGKPDHYSNYTEYFIMIWNTKLLETNYYQFNNILREGLQETSIPQIWTQNKYKGKKKNNFFFKHTVPIRFNQYCNSNYFKTHIHLIETKNARLKVELILENQHFDFLIYTISGFDEISTIGARSYIKELQLRAQWVCVIKLKMKKQRRLNQSILIEIKELISSNPNGSNNGLVVLFDEDHSKVLGHQYVNGIIHYNN